MKSVAAKGSVLLFLLYRLWYKEAFSDILLILYGGTALIVFTTLLYVDHKPLKALLPAKGILMGIYFGIYSLFTGLVVATNRGLLVSSIITYMAFLLICVCICIICYGENSIQWLLKCIAIVSYVCAFYTLFFGKPFYNGIYVTTMGPDNNPNALGIMMVFGMFSVLYNKKRKIGELILPLASVILFAYVIILTGSRKSLLCGGLLCFVWLINFVIDTHKLTNSKEKMIKYALLIAVLTIGVVYFVKHYASTASFERLTILSKDGSSSNRMEMYRESLELFKTSKLFGIGFDQFRVHSSFKTYAHSTYAELLADAGIFGCILYLYPIIKTGITLMKRIWKKPSYQLGMLLALFLVEVFLGAAIIYMYSLDQLVIWSILYMATERTLLIEKDDQQKGDKLCQKSAPT